MTSRARLGQQAFNTGLSQANADIANAISANTGLANALSSGQNLMDLVSNMDLEMQMH